MECTQLINLLEAERKDLIKEIEKEKGYLSEKEGRDVGWEKAEKSFLENYLRPWAEGYKKCYCHLVCKEENCEVKKGSIYELAR